MTWLLLARLGTSLLVSLAFVFAVASLYAAMALIDQSIFARLLYVVGGMVFALLLYSGLLDIDKTIWKAPEDHG